MNWNIQLILFDLFDREEEFYLVKFFGEDYVQYRNKVPIRIPFLENAIKRKFPEWTSWRMSDKNYKYWWFSSIFVNILLKSVSYLCYRWKLENNKTLNIDWWDNIKRHNLLVIFNFLANYTYYQHHLFTHNNLARFIL